MGYRVGTECVPDLLMAARVMCANHQGITAAGSLRCMSVSGSAGGYVLDVRSTGPGGTGTMSQLEVPQIPCDENERVADLAELFGLGLVAVLGVFLVREFVYRLVMPQ